MPQFGLITPAQAMRRIGTPDAPTVIDVRTDEDVAALPRMVPTARHVPHRQIATLTDPPGHAIVVCTKGRKLSEGAAAWLRTMGWQAEVLEGGTLAWEAAGLPMTPLATLPAPGHSLGHPPPPEDRPYRLSLADPPVHRPCRPLPLRRPCRSRRSCRPLRRHPL